MIVPMDLDYLDDSESSSEEAANSRKHSRKTATKAKSEDDAYDWKAENLKPVKHKFVSVTGATVKTKKLSRREVFELFFNQELVTKIVTETNKYGATSAEFSPISDAELKLFIALCILMSLVCKPTIESYWTTDKSIETPYFKNVMSYERFISIAKTLRFSSEDDSKDPFLKIRELSQMIKNTFIRLYVPHKNISIDESLMQCRTRLHYIQFTRTNGITFGIKFYKLCDIETRYIHNFNVYVGNVSASRNVVMNLLKESGLLHKGYAVYVDNCHSSPGLYRDLYKMGTNVCGLVRTNSKDLPKELKLYKLEKGEAVIYSTEEMAAIKWMGNKDVVVLTTMHGLDFVETGRINQSTGLMTFKPTALMDYYKKMGGADAGNQMLSKFHTMQRCKEACKKIFFYFVDMMLLNSYVICRHQRKDPAFHVYKQMLAEEIIGMYLLHMQSGKTPKNYPIERYIGRHFPVRIPPTASKGCRTSKRCVVCLSHRIRRESVFKCHLCDVALCIDHFKVYHER